MNDVRPFEEYKEMIQDMRKEEMIRGLYNLSARVTKQENIIKEVREKLLCYGETFDLKVHQEMQKELLEILDKENI